MKLLRPVLIVGTLFASAPAFAQTDHTYVPGTDSVTGTTAAPQSLINAAVNAFNAANGCRNRAGENGSFGTIDSGSNMGVYVANGTLVDNNIQLCGGTFVLPGGTTVIVIGNTINDGTVTCNQADSLLHEMAHSASGLTDGQMHPLGSGDSILRPGQVSGTIIADRTIDNVDCTQLDHHLGDPDYNNDGDEIGPPPPGTPILLDIGGRHGIRTTGVDDPVLFDNDVDGVKETMTWSAHGRGQAFLALDLSGNGAIDDGSELFGSGTFLADGIQADHGFAGLAQYDLPDNGGTGDGVIDATDAVWSRLRLWSDVNHDALSQRSELRTLGKYDVVALELDFVETRVFDRHGNWHRFRGYFHKRTKIHGRWTVTRELMEDVVFQVIQ